MSLSRSAAFSGSSALLAAALVGCNAAPIAPMVQVEPRAPTTADALELKFVTRAEDPNGEDTLSYQIRWSLDGEAVPDLDDALSLDHALTAKGQTWTAVVTPVDARGLPGQGAAAEVVIRNTPPTATVTIEPVESQPGQPLLAVPQGADEDGDALTWRYAWLLDGAPTEYVEAELPEGLSVKGDLWTAQAFPFDGEDEGEPAEATISVDNGLPVGVGVVIDPDTAYTDTLLTAIPEGFDEDGDVLTWSFAWSVGGEIVEDVTGPELTGDRFAKGDRVVVEATPNDGFVDGNTVRSFAIRIQNSTPTVVAAAITPTEAYRSTTLTCIGSGYEDLDDDPEGYRFAWFVDGVSAGTEPTLDGTSFRKGQSVVCEATAFDGEQPGTSARSESVRILNTAPIIDLVAIDNPSPKAGDTLGARITGGRDDDGDPLTYRSRWFADGSVVGTDATLTSASFRRGQAIQVEVTPFDGEAEGEPVTSAAVTVLNTAPEMASVTLGPDPAFTEDTVTATAVATDADGDALTFRYAWTVNGSAAGGSGSTLASSSFVRGDVVRVTATPTDGALDGEALISAPLTISNAIPSITSVAIDPTDLGGDDEARCVPEGWSDADGDAESYRYVWTVNGAAVAETETLTGADFDRGDVIVCTATPFDGRDEGDPVTSGAITIRNTVPELDGVTLSTDEPLEGDTVYATLSGEYDADGDAVAFRYAWYVNGALVATTETLSSDLFDKGDAIYVEVTPTDGSGDGATVTSATVTVGNTVPVMGSVTLSPTAPRTTEAVVATASGSDVDPADTLTYRYTWYVDGAKASDTGATLSSSSFTKHQSIYVEVVANDGDADSGVLTSATIKAVNTAPSITGVSISPSSDVGIEDTLTCVPTGWSDADGDAEDYRYTWTVDGDVKGTSATLAGGFSKGNVVTCTATPYDGESEGAAFTSTSVTVGNSTPTLASATISPSSPKTTDALSVTLGDATDADGDTVSFTYAWYVDGSLVSTSSTLSTSLTSRGDEVYVIVTPTDGTASGEAVTSDTVTIENTLPVVSGLSLSPTSPKTADTVTASYAATDADDDAVSLTWTWFVDGADVGVSGSTLAGSYFAKGDEIRVEVVPNDGTGDGTKVVSATITVVNALPVISGVTLSPSEIDASSSVTCVPEGWSDADGDAAGYRYAWTVDGATVSETSSVLASTAFEKGDRIQCTVTPDDGEGLGTPVSSAVATVGNSAPSLDSVSITPTDPTKASTLTAVLGGSSDPDGDAVSFRYAWKVGSTTVGTGSTLSASGLKKGDVVTLTVTPTDGSSDGAPVTSSSVTVLNTAPVLSAVTLTPSAVGTTGTVTAVTTASDLDADTLTYTYTWYVGGAVASETGRTLGGSFFDRDDEIYVVVTASDGTATSSAVTSSSLTVGNTPPSITGVTLSPSALTTTTDVTCTPFGWSDADGDAADYKYAWTIDGATVDGETTSLLPASKLVKGEEVRCIVTPTDGFDDGAPVSSGGSTVANTAPVVSAVTLAPTSPQEKDTVTVSITASDAEDDAISYVYAWTVNGASVSHTGSTLPSSWFKKGDTIKVTVTPSDGTLSGAAVSSSEITAVNTAPVIASLVLSPNPAYTTTSLTATPTASDADADTLAFVYGWYVNGTKQSATGSVLASSSFVKGNTVYAEVTALDGDTSTGPFVSSALTITNSTPTAPGAVDLTPPDPASTDDLVCVVGAASTDVDGDALTYEYEFYRDSAFYGSFTSSAREYTLAAGLTSGGETWYCRVRAQDTSGANSGWSGNSETRTVAASSGGTVTFTPCGHSGNTGPTQTQCDTAYASGPLAGKVTVTGGRQAWTVPSSGTYRIEACGAAGHSADRSYDGGRGACIAGDYFLSAGEVLTVAVGQRGTGDGCSGGGGGGSFVIDGSSRIVAVGGGGGGTRTSVRQNGCDAQVGEYAGDASGSADTWTCGTKASGLRGGGIVSSGSWGSGGAGFDADGSGEYDANNGGKRWSTLTGGGSSSYIAYGGFGGGGAGNGSCGGGGGGGYSGGDGGRIAGGGGSFHAGTSVSARLNAYEAHGEVVVTKLSDAIDWDGKRTFTNCSQTGRTGPSASQCTSAYADTPLADEVTVSSGLQTWTVPASGTYTITACGAAGFSAATTYKGGRGACVGGDFSLTEGEQLTIAVGQRGAGDGCSGGGGGASFVVTETGTPLVVGGGGGGNRTGASQNGCDGLTGEYGGTASGSGSTWACGAKTTDLKLGGRVSASSWGSAGGGFDGDGAGEFTSETGGKRWSTLTGGGSSSYTAFGGFGAGGSGNGSCGGGGGGGYSGGDGGWIGGGGGSFNGGTNKTTGTTGYDEHGTVTIDLVGGGGGDDGGGDDGGGDDGSTVVTKVYLIPVGNLVNQGADCSSTGHKYNGCSGNYGFHWTDTEAIAPTKVEVEYNHGINCGTGTRTAYLNGGTVGTASTGDAYNCYCDASGGQWVKSVTITSLSGYTVGGRNDFLMSSSSCEGFSPNATWSGNYARVTVTY
jgi:hypothetical protein